MVARSSQPGLTQAYVFLAFAAVLIAALPMLLRVPDHRGQW